MSFNIRGLEKPSNKSSSCRLLDLHKPNVIMVQEAMGEGKKFTKEFSKSWKEWELLGLYSMSWLECSLSKWRLKSLKLTHYMMLISRIGVVHYSLDFKKALNIVNVYGSYKERISFRDDLLE
jgi:hypothetical protein